MTTSMEPEEMDLGSPFDTAGPDEGDAALSAEALEGALSTALANEQLRLHYQPVIDVATDRITGVEALLRWEHPCWGTLSPRRFLAVAEKSGLMVDIGNWVFRRACQDLRSWEQAGCADVRVDLNISPAQFRDAGLVDKLQEALSESDLAPRRLCLEVAEATLMQDPEWAVALLRQLKELGTGLTVDDYGSGFLPLAALRRFPLDRIKIGRLLMRDMETEDDDAAIVKAIVAHARRAGMRSCAEGVENDLQCQRLREILCDEMQGHLFCRALPASRIALQVREGKALAGHLARLRTPRRTLLLVDDEANIVAALKRLFRRDGYEILTAHGGQEALDVLKQHEVDVIVPDQRMPGMTGTELLHIAKDLYPDTMRIVLSGYTELQSVTDAVNEGAIYKFLTKPWDDEQLRAHVAEAFQRKVLADENRRLALEVRTANQELAKANRQLEELLKQKQLQIKRDAVSLDIVREALQHVPLPVIGLDEEEVIAFVNSAAQALFAAGGPILGCDARQVTPELIGAVDGAGDGEMRAVAYRGTPFQIALHSMGKGSASRGKLLILTR
ncbi:MAG TPA: EAL domain-containing protein [Paucimonas sp.]|nr:EAL domain-containing protein [Paucimonas sp.]